jgi:hypothetical protein
MLYRLNMTLLYIRPSSKFYYVILAVIALIVAAIAFVVIVKTHVHK